MLKVFMVIIQILIISALWYSNMQATVTYNLPFLHTSAGAVTYCWLSNTTTNAVSASFTVMASNSSTSPSQTAISGSFSISGKQTTLLTFTGQTIQSGLTSISIASDTSGTDIAYGLKMEISGGSCESVGMSCFQGTTSPRRNLTGYTCNDGNHYGF